MEITPEKASVNAMSQTEWVKNSILWQCKYVLQTVSEFQNLAYRVTKTQNDIETLVVYREGILGIFGPPVDPITLTLDPKGRCVINVLFKQVQRVSIVSSQSGHIEVASLLAVLRLIAGKGYTFCPGIPEKFLAQKSLKTSGKYVIIHRVPFKRYQSPQCPVYYQTQAIKQSNSKASLFAICPQCMQAAKIIQSLSFSPPPVVGAIKHQSEELAAHSQPQKDPPEISVGRSASIHEVNANTLKNTLSAFTSRQPASSDSIKREMPVSPAGLQNNGTSLGKCQSTEQKTKKSVNRNCEAHITNGHISITEQQTHSQEKIETFTSEAKKLMNKLLNERSKQKSMDSSSYSTEITDGKISNGNACELPHSTRAATIKVTNTCHLCKKQYSSHSSLLKHLLRHKTFSKLNFKQIRKLKSSRSNNALSLYRIVSRGLKASSLIQSKPQSHLSGSSLRLFLKYFNDLLPLLKGSASHKQKLNALRNKDDSYEAVKHVKAAHDSPQPHSRVVNGTCDKKSTMKKTSNSLSPMQTLLEAADKARSSQENISSPTISSSSSSSLVMEKIRDTAILSTASQSIPAPTKMCENNITDKKSRKRSKVTSKQIRSNKKSKTDKITSKGISVKNEIASSDQSMLTNLNLLSTVSVETAMKEAPGATQNHAGVSNSVPGSVSPNIATEKITDFSQTIDSTLFNKALNDSESLIGISKLINIHNLYSMSEQNGSKSSEHSKKLSLSNGSDHLLLIERSEANAVNLQGSSQQLDHLKVSATVPINLVAISNSQAKTSALQFTPAKIGQIKNNSVNNESGPMDLSKPKSLSSTAVADIPSAVGQTFNKSGFSGLPQSFAKHPVNKDIPEVAQGLTMETKSSAVNIFPLSVAVNGHGKYKNSDSELQARMFAGASKYKINGGKKIATDVQAVMASSNHQRKGSKSSEVTGEIQCGYKWSGSGGLVKERTQIIRELLSSDVMANFLAKSQQSAAANMPTNLNLVSNTKSQGLVLHPGLLSTAAQNTSQNVLSPIHELNFATGKSHISFASKDALSRLPTPIPSFVICPPSPINDSTVNFSGDSILRSALTSSTGFRGFSPIHKDTACRSAPTSPNKLKYKTRNLTPSPSPVSPRATASVFPQGSLSSPSLAAFHCKPLESKYEVNDGKFLNNINITLAPSVSMKPQSTTGSFTQLLSSLVNIKKELVEPYSPEHDTVIMTLPIKTEKLDPDMPEDYFRGSNNNSPAELVIDTSPNLGEIDGTKRMLKSGACAINGAADLYIK